MTSSIQLGAEIVVSLTNCRNQTLAAETLVEFYELACNWHEIAIAHLRAGNKRLYLERIFTIRALFNTVPLHHLLFQLMIDDRMEFRALAKEAFEEDAEDPYNRDTPSHDNILEKFIKFTEDEQQVVNEMNEFIEECTISFMDVEYHSRELYSRLKKWEQAHGY